MRLIRAAIPRSGSLPRMTCRSSKSISNSRSRRWQPVPWASGTKTVAGARPRVSRDGHLARFGELLSKAVGLHHADSLGATAIVTQRYPWLKTVPQPAVERDSPDLGRALRAPGSHAVQKRPTFTVRLRGIRHEPLRPQAPRRPNPPLS